MEIVTTLNSYQSIQTLYPVLAQFSNQYVIENGVFYSKNPPCCPYCGQKMVHNGSNTLTKKNVATLKIGKYRCQQCKKIYKNHANFLKHL